VFLAPLTFGHVTIAASAMNTTKVATMTKSAVQERFAADDEDMDQTISTVTKSAV
ncbi:hypothetical protein Tco_1578063, partial [Tanacetum coccineum]